MSRKFHDYDMMVSPTIRVHGEYIQPDHGYRLTNLPRGALCLIWPNGSGWSRKTRNANGKGSTRYSYHATLDQALDAGVKWAWRKDMELARPTK